VVSALEVETLRESTRTKKALLRREKKKQKELRKTERKKLVQEKNEKRLKEQLQRRQQSEEGSTILQHPPNFQSQSRVDLPDMDDISKFASIDLGMEILAAIYVPEQGARPFLISGREIKRANWISRCQLSRLSSKHGKFVNRHYDVLNRRTRLISNYLHTASRMVIDYLQQFGIRQLVIGYNAEWKQRLPFNSATNDAFYKIPYRNFIEMIRYKGADAGITVIENEEKYTSKCDALMDETVGFHNTYTGRRTVRGRFISGKGCAIHADVNGAINILRKWIAKAYSSMSSDLKHIIDRTHQIIKSPMRSGIVIKIAGINGESYLRQCVVRRGCDHLV
jgi:IS605 OrfB family transposase